MGKTFNVSSPTAEFGFNSGDNRDRYIIARANATAAYLATTARASKIAFVIPSGTATVDTQILNVIPAESVITDVAAVYTSAVDLGANGTLSLAIGSTSGGAEICSAATVATAGSLVVAGAVQSINSIPAAGGSSFVFVTGAVKYFAATQSLFVRSVVATNAMSVDANITLVVNYVTL
jgi:hypothetical protein|tara:strand:+ start:982 stop:1515 length:534 start_codon:yes stop_codon:yes gene_type:complete